jgi:hypothetical protein
LFNNKKKISYAEWTEIGIHNYATKWLRPLCRYDLIRDPSGKFKREQRVGLCVYILLFIPVHLLQALLCMWDGGLKEFEVSERYLGCDWLSYGTNSYEIAKRIWNEKAVKNSKKLWQK